MFLFYHLFVPDLLLQASHTHTIPQYTQIIISILVVTFFFTALSRSAVLQAFGHAEIDRHVSKLLFASKVSYFGHEELVGPL